MIFESLFIFFPFKKMFNRQIKINRKLVFYNEIYQLPIIGTNQNRNLGSAGPV